MASIEIGQQLMQESRETSRPPSRLKRALVAGVAAVSAVAGINIATTESASASPTCYGDWCSGQDPNTTGCANDAKTVATARITTHEDVIDADGGHRVYRDMGTVELRWSQKCKTNWARANVHSAGPVYKVIAEQDTGYSQVKETAGFQGGTEPGIFYTGMIYSPVHQVFARVEGQRLDSSSTDWK